MIGGGGTLGSQATHAICGVPAAVHIVIWAIVHLLFKTKVLIPSHLYLLHSQVNLGMIIVLMSSLLLSIDFTPLKGIT